jgi:23S rRNA (adenine2030-N6)-methyltransferase
MNYRHAYHAGNFADVLKHAVLTLVIEHLKLKPAPFRVIDTHAGIGSYDLSSIEAQKTGEWREGVGRLIDAVLPAEAAGILEPYLATVRRENDGNGIVRYPGSPQIARSLLRPIDRLVVNELHPEDSLQLSSLFAGDPQTKVLSLDGWDAVKALLPPKERRGVTLIDPPFEQSGEFARLVVALREAHKRFATGTVIVWYPIKDERAVQLFEADVERTELSKVLSVVLRVREPDQTTGLHGTGLVISNPPFTLEGKLEVVLPLLGKLLGQGLGARTQVAWLKREQPVT